MSDMSFAIHRLAAGEGEVFRNIRLTAFRLDEDSFASSLAEELSKPMDWFETRVQQDAVFVARNVGGVLGVVGLSAKAGSKEAHKGFVYSMFVLPGARGRGVGQALMAALLEEAQARFESVQLIVVSTNASAVALYQRAGFESYGLEPRALKTAAGVYTDDLLMWKLLR
ncbi:MAG: GNAT family N-acetyltransferase [Caulobacteraceae bacterium]|nr:GNAT family N-acetyltransferase [Caulobacteraceae bacterium]